MITNSIVMCLVFISAFLGVGVLVLALHGRFLGPSDSPQGRELAGSIAFRIASIFSIVLGLVFSSANSQFSDAQQNVQEQAIIIGKSYMLLEQYDGEQAKSVQEDLVALARQSIEELEGSEIGVSPLSPSGRQFAKLQNAAFKLDFNSDLQRELRASLVGQISQLRDLRVKRFAVKWGMATAGFWVFLLFGFAAIAFCFGAYSLNLRRHLYTTLFFVFVGITAFFIYELSNPYSGPIRVSSAAFEEVKQAVLSLTEEK